MCSLKVNEIILKARVVFWDFDGTIKETVEVKAQAFIRLFGHFGEKIKGQIKEHHEANGGMSRFTKIPLYLTWAKGQASEEEIDNMCKQFSRIVFESVIKSEWVLGVNEYLISQHSKQDFILITATPQEEIEQILTSLGIKSCFKEVFGAPSRKEVVIRDVLDRLEYSSSETVMVGDSEEDLKAAQVNAVPFVLRRTLHNSSLQAFFNGPMFNDMKNG